MERADATAIDVAFLGRAAIFGGLSERMLARILEAARLIRIDACNVVFEEGEPASCMFLVCSGELEIRKRRSDGRLAPLARLRPGDCVGEMSLIEIQPRSASAIALEPATLLVLDHAQITRLYQLDLEVYTLLVLNIAREISRRLRVADQRLIELAAEAPTLAGTAIAVGVDVQAR